MKFVDAELEARTEEKQQNVLRCIANRECPPVFELQELFRYNSLPTERFDVNVSGTIFECLISPSVRKKLYVFLSNNYRLGDPERKKHAFFFRMTWHRYFPGICLNIEDPMIKKYTNISWGGYIGGSENFYVDGVVAIVEKVAELYGIDHENIIFLGLSSGGFAALHAAAKMPHTSCVVENPQIYVDNWTSTEALSRAMGEDFQQDTYRHRLALDEAIIRNKTSKFRIFCNAASELDYDKQLKIFLAKLGITDVRQNYYHLGNIEIYFLDTPNGHVSWLSPLSVYLATCADRFDDAERECMLAMMRDMNKEKYQLKKALLPSKAGRLYDILTTGRVDVKSSGQHNDLEIESIGNEEVNISAPSWYVDEAGTGYVLTGRQGKIKVRIRCKGDGVLNIYLRGLDVRDKSGGRIPFKVTYTGLRINDKEIIVSPQSIWHDKPLICHGEVKDGAVMELEASWQVFSYEPGELDMLAREMA
ncbi:MAG: hypothetical protein J6N51_12570 [Selenomonas sp.]|nr:hypothetical protein [Selenomonas sp.]